MGTLRDETYTPYTTTCVTHRVCVWFLRLKREHLSIETLPRNLAKMQSILAVSCNPSAHAGRIVPNYSVLEFTKVIENLLAKKHVHVYIVWCSSPLFRHERVISYDSALCTVSAQALKSAVVFHYMQTGDHNTSTQ